ncbi:MAG: hypothetical protein ACXVP0_12850 [Bacteroidia bacterium]
MDVKEIKEKVLAGQLSDEELGALLGKHGTAKKGSGLLKALANGFEKGYTEPQILKLKLEAILLFMIITGAILLSCLAVMDVMATAVLLSVVTGYLLGRTH